LAQTQSSRVADSSKVKSSKSADKTIKASHFRKLHAERNKENNPDVVGSVAGSSKHPSSAKQSKDKTIKASQFRKRAAEEAKKVEPVVDTDAGLWGTDSPDVSEEPKEIPPEQPSTSGVSKKSFITCRPMNVLSPKTKKAATGSSIIGLPKGQGQARLGKETSKKVTATRLDGQNKISKNKKVQPGNAGSKARSAADKKKLANTVRKAVSKKEVKVVDPKSDENLFDDLEEKVCSSEAVKELFGKNRNDVKEAASCEIGGDGLMAECDEVKQLSQEMKKVQFGDECLKEKNPNLDFLDDNDIHKYHRFIPSDTAPGEIEHDVILTDEEVDDDDIIDGVEERDSDAEEYSVDQANKEELDSLSKSLATQKKSEDLGKKQKFVIEQEKSKNL